uniref:C40 family peptidase n=1 Tax=Herbidospora sakaeratensis TaxID=564415 RepID=UPI0007814B50|nr:NlpC/P60 family protein [Herbidospora sakaeratensis]
MLTTLLTAILCTPHPGAEPLPCPAPASFRYVNLDEPDELDELIDLAELAERWGHTWPPPEWDGFDPWAADGPWAEAWDDFAFAEPFAEPGETVGGVFGPSDRGPRPSTWGGRPLQDGWPILDGRTWPGQERGSAADGGVRPLQDGGALVDGGARPPQNGGALVDGGARPRQAGGALVDGGARPGQDRGAVLDGVARPGQDGVVTLDPEVRSPQEETSSQPEGGKPRSDDRGPRSKSEEPPGVDVEPRKKRDDREPRKDGENTTPRDATPGAIALRAATKWLGIPYVWGGGNANGPSRGVGKGAGRVGFDCSGLTLAAWAKAGVTLGHYTGTQIKQGKSVQTKDLLPGDLLFFGATKTDPSHVGLYAGDGDMIHAPKTGDVVKRVEVLAAPVWMKRFQGAVRPQRPSSKV